MKTLSFQNGTFFDTKSSHEISIYETDNGIALHTNHSRSKRFLSGIIQAILNFFSIGQEECPELLDWPKFQPFTYNKLDVGCWDDVQPTFKLFPESTIPIIIADQKDHLKQLKNLDIVTNMGITKIVIIVHGFTETASSWADPMARWIMAKDKTPNLAVITIDWKKEAEIFRGLSDFSLRPYRPAHANSRYVGVAAERVIKQFPSLKETHCIGQSLGAHVCAFLSNAMMQDMGVKLNRISAMDPAGPLFYTTVLFNKPIYAKLDEKLDKSDADLVDVIHSDSDMWGFYQSAGHADFYIGKNLEQLGKDQAECSGLSYSSLFCDHFRAMNLYYNSIRNKDRCWVHFRCDGEDGRI